MSNNENVACASVPPKTLRIYSGPDITFADAKTLPGKFVSLDDYQLLQGELAHVQAILDHTNQTAEHFAAITQHQKEIITELGQAAQARHREDVQRGR